MSNCAICNAARVQDTLRCTFGHEPSFCTIILVHGCMVDENDKAMPSAAQFQMQTKQHSETRDCRDHTIAASRMEWPGHPCPDRVPPPSPNLASLGTSSCGNSARSQNPAIIGATSFHHERHDWSVARRLTYHECPCSLLNHLGF